MSRLLIVDDDAALARSLELTLRLHGHEAESAPTVARGRERALAGPFDLALVDRKLPDGDGLELLRELVAARPGLRVALMTGEQDMKSAIEAMKAGAFDYLRKPFDVDEMLALVEKARLRASAVDAALPGGLNGAGRFEIVGRDRRVLEALKQVGLLARSEVTVLLEGESGTGKELLARAIHEASRPGLPFVAINCSGIVATLLESELFGHEKGAYTGAVARKEGKLEHAGGGTLLLDEIGDMPPDLQAKLLRVLEEREFTRVGGLDPIPFRARVVAATNRDLERMAREGAFREDLFYRVAASRLSLPPLRERLDDLPLLVPHLLERIGRRLGRGTPRLTRETLDRLYTHDFPGNIRELDNLLARAAAVAGGEAITPADLALPASRPTAETPAPASPPPAGAPPPPPEGRVATLAEAERAHIAAALAALGWNITRTARALDISPTTLRKKIADFRLARPAGGNPPGPGAG